MVCQASIKSTAIYEMVTHNNSINRTSQKLRFLVPSALGKANVRSLKSSYARNNSRGETGRRGCSSQRQRGGIWSTAGSPAGRPAQEQGELYCFRLLPLLTIGSSATSCSALFAGANELPEGAGLGPMGVLPEFQIMGIGSKLIAEGTRKT